MMEIAPMEHNGISQIHFEMSFRFLFFSGSLTCHTNLKNTERMAYKTRCPQLE